MSIIFYDVEDWEMERLPSVVAGVRTILETGHLTSRPALAAKEAKIVSVFSWSQVDKDVINALPALRHIATRSTGVDHIDLTACHRRGIIVNNVPGYGERTVAEHTFALILALS